MEGYAGRVMTTPTHPLKYHQATFDLLAIEPHVSPEAVEHLKQVEQRLGQPLPAAVREWYALQYAVAILARYSNEDHPLSIQKLGNQDLSMYKYSQERLLAEGMLVFLIENQAVCYWAVWLDGSDDPPVVVGIVGSTAIRWDIHAEHFSTFVYTRVWDFQPWVDTCCYLYAHDQLLAPADLTILRSQFREGPQTYAWPATISYRFSRDGQRTVIWNDEHRQADWSLWASSEQGLHELVSTVWHCGTLAETLEPGIVVSYEEGHEEYGPDPAGERVLTVLRNYHNES
jgi:hypothetical protein